MRKAVVMRIRPGGNVTHVAAVVYRGVGAGVQVALVMGRSGRWTLPRARLGGSGADIAAAARALAASAAGVLGGVDAGAVARLRGRGRRRTVVMSVHAERGVGHGATTGTPRLWLPLDMAERMVRSGATRRVLERFHAELLRGPVLQRTA